MDLTQINQRLELIAAFYSGFEKTILNKSAEASSKQVYYLDNQETIKQYVSFLRDVMGEASFPEQTRQDAELLFKQFQKTTEQFKKDCLTINPDVTQEDMAVQLNENTIKQAAQTNQTTQKMVKDIDTLAKQQAQAAADATALTFNHALIMDGKAVYFMAKDKQEAADFVAAEVAANNPKTVSAYEVSFKPLKLTTKTIVTLE